MAVKGKTLHKNGTETSKQPYNFDQIGSDQLKNLQQNLHPFLNAITFPQHQEVLDVCTG